MLGLHFGGSAASEGRRHCHEASRALGGRGWRSACWRASRVRSTCGRPMHLRRGAPRPFGVRPPPHRGRSAGREPRRWRPYSWFPPGIRGSLRSSSAPPVGDRPGKGARDAHRCGPRTSGSPRPNSPHQLAPRRNEPALSWRSWPKCERACSRGQCAATFKNSPPAPQRRLVKQAGEPPSGRWRNTSPRAHRSARSAMSPPNGWSGSENATR